MHKMIWPKVNDDHGMLMKMMRLMLCMWKDATITLGCYNIGIHDYSNQDHLGFRKPVRGYEFFQNSKLSGSNFSKWKVDH